MNIIESLERPDLFKPWFLGSTWRAWITFLKALFALPFNADDETAYELHTKRSTAPQNAFREAWLVVGRRGGKSLIAALVAVFLACFKDYSKYLQPGEVGTVMVLAADRKQSRTILKYIKAFLAVPMLRTLVQNETQQSIELSNGITIEIHTASFRSVRGYTLVAVIADEIAFWRSEDSANPDTEIIAAVRPGLATIPGALLLGILDSYARRGVLWETYSRYFGKSSNVLVWQGTSQEMNPALVQSVIDQALEEDEASARAEYFAEFRTDLERFVSREVIEACTISGRHELPLLGPGKHVAFTDPAGGSGTDSFTLAIAHGEGKGTDSKVIIDCLREIRPKFNPDAVVEELVGVLLAYGINAVMGDAYAGDWPTSRFAAWGVRYVKSPFNKSQIYTNVLPLLNAQRIQLLDNKRLRAQLQSLERRTSRGTGHDSIDHPPGAQNHDDLSNAVCGVSLLVSRLGHPRRVIGAETLREEREIIAGRRALMEALEGGNSDGSGMRASPGILLK